MSSETQQVNSMLARAGLPETFDALPLHRATNNSWQVLAAGDYDGKSDASTLSAAEEYYATANVDNALPLNQYIEWPGMLSAIVEELRQKTAPAIFEIGGGNGGQMNVVINTCQPKEMVFIEYSRKMLELAQANLGDQRITWIHASAEEGLTQLGVDSQDLGFASLVLHYLNPHQLALFYLRLSKVLKSDASFLFTGGTPEFNEFLYPGVSKSDIRNGTWYMFDTAGNPVWEMRANTYWPEDHRALAEQVGLQVSIETLKPQIPDEVNRDSLKPVWDLLHSPVWNLYRVSRTGV